MIGLIGRLSAKVSDMSLVARCAWLNGSLAVVLAACLAVAAISDNPHQIAAVLVAAFVCTLFANVALILAVVLKAPGGLGVLAGSLVGMFPPLAAALLLQQRGGTWSKGTSCFGSSCSTWRA